MSMDLLREAARRRLVTLCDACLATHRTNRLTPTTVMEDGRIVPAPTMEFMGARAVEINAKLDAYMQAIKILDDEYKRIVDPSSAQEPKDDPNEQPDPNERFY
jgi:hypothetical protein